MFFYSSIIFGQCIKKEKIIFEGYYGPKQEGRLDVVKTDSITYLKTDSSALKILKETRIEVVQFFDRKDKMTKIQSIRCDSLGILLFENGLLTSDLLKKSYNSKRTKVTSRVDKEDITRHVDEIDYALYGITIAKFKKRNLKKYLSFNISILHLDNGKDTTDSSIFYQQCLGVVSSFNLILSAPIEGNIDNLYEFISQAKFICLLYDVTGIIM